MLIKRSGLLLAVFIMAVELVGTRSVKGVAANVCAAKLQAEANAVAQTGTIPFYLVTGQSTPIGRSTRNTVSYTEGRLSYEDSTNTLTGTGDQSFNDRRFTFQANSADSPFSPASVDRLRIDISLDNSPQITFTLLSWGNVQTTYPVLCDHDLLYGFMGDTEMYVLSLQQTAVGATQTALPVRGSVTAPEVVGGPVGQTISIKVEFQANSPYGQVTDLRLSGSCPTTAAEMDTSASAWEPFVSTKTFEVAIFEWNWTRWSLAVQYRDAQGHLSPVYCAATGVEGAPKLP